MESPKVRWQSASVRVLREVKKTMQTSVKQKIAFLRCPQCGKTLQQNGEELQCSECPKKYPVDNGIPQLYQPNDWEDSKSDVTVAVKSFYERTPFPNYDDVDTIWKFQEKADKSIFARLLDTQIPEQAVILEAGCGTGQLSNFLGIRGSRTIFATDICMNSLKLGNDFRERNQIHNVYFLQMNLFKPVFSAGTFDFIICSGVLHHTSDPYLGLVTLSSLAKKGGFVVIGLYNRFGRIVTDIRRHLFKFTGDRFVSLDPRLRKDGLSDTRKQTWFLDQYRNPHESKHTMGEVLKWFDKCELEFISAIPKPVAFEPFSRDEKLFEKQNAGTRIDRFIVQLALLFSGGREGGFFTMIGRKK